MPRKTVVKRLRTPLSVTLLSVALGAPASRATDDLTAPNRAAAKEASSSAPLMPAAPAIALEAMPSLRERSSVLRFSLTPQGAGEVAPDKPEAHRFLDRPNLLLFSLLAASRALDYSSTLNMRRRGRQEILLSNAVVDNHAAFAAIEAGGVAVSIGASYLFHLYHHHRLERWTSIIHSGLATSGAVRNYCLKTAQASTTP